MGDERVCRAMLSHLRRITSKQYLLIALGVTAFVALAVFYQRIDIDGLHRRAEALNGFVVFACMTVLPLLGFPATVVHAVAGVRFGIGPGCALVAISILLQLLGAYGLVRLAPGFFARKLEPLRKRLPKGTHTPVTLFTMLLPGVPYVGQIYVLPLVGVPLSTYLLYSFPINVARSVVGVTFGEISDELTPLRLAGFVIYFLGITIACTWAFRLLRRRLREARNAPGTPTPLSEPVGGWEHFLAKRREARRKRAALSR